MLSPAATGTVPFANKHCTLTLRGVVIVLKAAYFGPQKLAEGCFHLIDQFHKGALRVTLYHRGPSVPPPQWNLELVLSTLQHEPFQAEGNSSAKMAFPQVGILVSIVLGKRMGEAFLLFEKCCSNQEDIG